MYLWSLIIFQSWLHSISFFRCLIANVGDWPEMSFLLQFYSFSNVCTALCLTSAFISSALHQILNAMSCFDPICRSAKPCLVTHDWAIRCRADLCDYRDKPRKLASWTVNTILSYKAWKNAINYLYCVRPKILKEACHLIHIITYVTPLFASTQPTCNKEKISLYQMTASILLGIWLLFFYNNKWWTSTFNWQYIQKL